MSFECTKKIVQLHLVPGGNMGYSIEAAILCVQSVQNAQNAQNVHVAASPQGPWLHIRMEVTTCSSGSWKTWATIS